MLNVLSTATARRGQHLSLLSVSLHCIREGTIHMFTQYILNEHLLCAGCNNVLVKTTPQYDKLRKGIHKPPGPFEWRIITEPEGACLGQTKGQSVTHTCTLKNSQGEVLERRREANFGVNTFNGGRRILRLRGLRPKAWRELGMSSWWYLLLHLLLRAFIYWLSKPEHLFCAKLPMAFGDRDKYVRRLFTWPRSLETIRETMLRKGKEDNQTSLETGQRFPRREHSSWALKHHHGGREGREIHCK